MMRTIRFFACRAEVSLGLILLHHVNPRACMQMRHLLHSCYFDVSEVSCE